MISICIPIYNRKVTHLVSDLHKQCKALDSDYEIILIDDASEEEYKFPNREFLNSVNDGNIVYEELPENIGRSAIRNRFAQKASFPYLLFIDNDAKVCYSHFITRYLAIRTPGIVCYGGCLYGGYPDDSSLHLRWLYGSRREAVAADIRQKSPNHFFSTFNFLIDKRILLLHPFDEEIREYGYEDLLFKLQILKQGYTITQIENPLIHEGLIPCQDFIGRTETALKNLLRMQKNQELSNDLISSVNILRTSSKIDKWKLTGFTAWMYRLLKEILIKNLLNKKPCLFVFDLYKLGYLCNLKIRNKKC